MSATLRRLHRWIGFVTGPFVVLFALSGIALLLRGPIEARLEGRPPAVRADGRVPATPDAIADIARVPFPGAEVRAVRAPAEPDEAYRVMLAWRSDRVEVWVDPYARAVIHTRLPDRSVMVAVRSLHAALHLGGIGAALVALLGLAIAAHGALGFILLPRESARPVRGRAIRVHRVIGILALGGSLVLGLSGAQLAARTSTGAPAPGTGVVERLHRGDFAGRAGRVAWVATGLALPLLALSGYALSVRR
jgi:uncharacterized iron-regulated membrane protein